MSKITEKKCLNVNEIFKYDEIVLKVLNNESPAFLKVLWNLIKEHLYLMSEIIQKEIYKDKMGKEIEICIEGMITTTFLKGFIFYLIENSINFMTISLKEIKGSKGFIYKFIEDIEEFLKEIKKKI